MQSPEEEMKALADNLSKIQLGTAVLTERTEQIDKRFGNITLIFIVYSSFIAVLLTLSMYGIFSTRSEAIATAEKITTLNATVNQHTLTLDQMKTDVADIRSSLGEENITNIHNASVEIRQASEDLRETTKDLINNATEFNELLQKSRGIPSDTPDVESTSMEAFQVRMDDMSATIDEIKKAVDALTRE